MIDWIGGRGMDLVVLNVVLALVLIATSWAIGYVCGYEAAKSEE